MKLNTTREAIIIRIICLCLFIQLFISFKLWIPLHRAFPLVPAFHSLPVNWGFYGDVVLFSICCLGFVALIIKPYSFKVVVLLLTVFALFILEDIARFQPWVYLFGLILLILSVEKLNADKKIFLVILILSGTYFWSGFQKLNNAFTVEFYPWLLSPFGLQQFAEHYRLAGFIPGAFELLAGVLLLFKQTRRVGGIMAIVIHLFLLAALGPWALNWNKAIWPWEIAMAAIVFIVAFYTSSFSIAGGLLQLRKSILLYTVLILLFILPALNYFNLWDFHLSMSLYSGNNNSAIFYYNERDRKNLPVTNDKLLYFYEGTQTEYIQLDFWCMDDLESPFYPQERYFKEVGKQLCNCVTEKDSAGIKINVRDKFTSKPHLENYPCKELAK